MPRRGASPQRLLATVMFTDIVRSTQLAAELGDRNWKQVLARHNAFVRKQLKRHGGREVDTAGDGFFATFDQPARAIACATAISDELGRIGIVIRAGIHMGEVEVIGPKVGGIAVHIASRVMAKAEPGQVLVSSTVRDLMSGSDIRFGDQGMQELKGVPAQWRLFAVERETPAGPPPSAVAALEPEAAPRPVFTPLRIAVATVLVAAVALAAVLLATRGGGGGLAPPAINTVARIDPAGGKVLGGIPVGNTPVGLAAGEGGIWVVNFDDQTIQRIDPSANTVGPARALLGSPTAIAVGGGFVWVTSSYTGTLFMIDPTQAHANTPINVGVGAAGVAYGDGAVWVTNNHQDTVLRIDAQTHDVAAIQLERGSGPSGVAVGGGAVWVAESLKGQVARIDPTTRKVVLSVPVLRGQPEQVAFGEGYVWVSNTSDDSVTRIDPASNQGTTIEGVGNGPKGIAAGNGGVWVANSLDGTVAKIDPKSARVVDRLTVGFSPDGVAVSPGDLWVTIHGQ